jgi:urease accessory protein
VADLRASAKPAHGAAVLFVLNSSLLDVLQIADSAFPSGSYAHSMGLEALYARGEVELEAHLRFGLSNGLARVELPMIREAFCLDHPAGLVELDELMDVLLPVSEFRTASRSIGRSFLRAATDVRRVAAADVGVEHHAVVFGAVLHDWRLDLQDGQMVYAWQAMRQQLSAAQRLGKIGQTAMQDLLDRLKPAVLTAVETSDSVSREGAGGFAPWLDLAGMAHEQQFARMFSS